LASTQVFWQNKNGLHKAILTKLSEAFHLENLKIKNKAPLDWVQAAFFFC